MIAKDDFIRWRIAYLQYLCIHHNIPFTAKERTALLEYKLTQAGVPLFPSTPRIHSVSGSTQSPTVNVLFSGTLQILPDPQVTVNLKKGQTALVMMYVTLSSNVAGFVDKYAGIAYRKGTGNWTTLADWAKGAAPTGNVIDTLSIQHSLVATTDEEHTFGIRVASNNDTYTITAVNKQRAMTVIVF